MMPPTTISAISIRGISKRFGATLALDRVSFDVPAGSCFGLIGPNGAGKTTAFSIVAGYLKADDGAVLVLDHSAGAIRSLKGRLSVLPQDAALPALDTVGEFLTDMARLQGIEHSRAQQEARKSLDEVQGADWWQRRCGKLSHGMSKRVGLAQAFLGNPEVVLLDEPTAGLDPRISFEIREEIKRRKGSCTLVVSSHNLFELEQLCDAAAILDHGHLMASGSMQELTSSSSQIRIEVLSGPIPIDKVSAISGVKQADFDEIARTVSVLFDPTASTSEDMISQVLWLLLQSGIKISGVSKGRGLEKRVMELTD